MPETDELHHTTVSEALASQPAQKRREIDERVGAFLDRPIEGEWPYLWLDATYLKARRDDRIVSVAVIVAVAVNTDRRREVLGMTGNSEVEFFWTEFMRTLARRGLRGVKLVISDAHEGLKAAATRVLGATAQRCKIHFQRNALAHAGESQLRIVAAWIGTAFAEADQEAAHRQWRAVADQLRPRVPRLAELMDAAEHGEIKPLERGRHLPNEAAIRRLVGALLLEQHDEWATQRRYMPLETMAPIGDAAPFRLPSTPA